MKILLSWHLLQSAVVNLGVENSGLSQGWWNQQLLEPHGRQGSTDEAALAVPLMGPQQVMVQSYLGVENSGLSQDWCNQQLLEPAKRKES